jgi:AcrR family transcriptional regulator
MSGPVKRRPYSSTLRAGQATATRARILEAARSLFSVRGYPATTLDEVAAEAGVATDTVLHVFGSKKDLLHVVLDTVIGGDDAPVQFLDRKAPQAMRQETDQRVQIAMFAAGMTEQLERIRPLDDILRSAAVVDADARALRDDLQLRQRRRAMRQLATWIAANGRLKNDMAVRDAADVIWTLTSPDVHRLLCTNCGWKREQYQTWLCSTLQESLLPGPEVE